MTDEKDWMTLQLQIEAYVAEQIKQLEKRIIQLEAELSKRRLVMNAEDSWYWDH